MEALGLRDEGVRFIRLMDTILHDLTPKLGTMVLPVACLRLVAHKGRTRLINRMPLSIIHEAFEISFIR